LIEEHGMGLLDSIVGAVTGGGAQGGGQGAQLVGALLQQFGGGGGNGLAGLVQQLSQNGLGDVVQSWVGTGANLPVSAEQIGAALGGSGQLAQLAQQFGLDPNQLAGQLSQHLPAVVDQLTPGGQMPTGGMNDLLGQLGGLLKG
jgi:uncharacterized protein YidB (DUF937 family)